MITTIQNLEKFREKYSHQGDCMDHIKVGNDMFTKITIY